MIYYKFYFFKLTCKKISLVMWILKYLLTKSLYLLFNYLYSNTNFTDSSLRELAAGIKQLNQMTHLELGFRG